MKTCRCNVDWSTSKDPLNLCWPHQINLVGLHKRFDTLTVFCQKSLMKAEKKPKLGMGSLILKEEHTADFQFVCRKSIIEPICQSIKLAKLSMPAKVDYRFFFQKKWRLAKTWRWNFFSPLTLGWIQSKCLLRWFGWTFNWAKVKNIIDLEWDLSISLQKTWRSWRIFQQVFRNLPNGLTDGTSLNPHIAITEFHKLSIVSSNQPLVSNTPFVFKYL